jgi:hypothetical protein
MKSCKEIARLVSEQHDRQLPLRERLQVKLHLAVCALCRRFAKQIDFIGRLTRRAGEADPGSLVVEGAVYEETLSSDVKTRIKQEMERKNLPE